MVPKDYRKRTKRCGHIRSAHPGLSKDRFSALAADHCAKHNVCRRRMGSKMSPPETVGSHGKTVG